MAAPLAAIGTNAIRGLAKSAGNALKRAAPQIQERALNYISQATNGKVRNLNDGIAYASNSSAGLSLFAMNAARAGVSPQEMFTVGVLSQLREEERDAMMKNVQRAFENSYGMIDNASMLKGQGGLADEVLELEMINRFQTLMNINSGDRLLAAHATLKMILAMDNDRLSELIALKRAAGGI